MGFPWCENLRYSTLFMPVVSLITGFIVLGICFIFFLLFLLHLFHCFRLVLLYSLVFRRSEDFSGLPQPRDHSRLSGPGDQPALSSTVFCHTRTIPLEMRLLGQGNEITLLCTKVSLCPVNLN